MLFLHNNLPEHVSGRAVVVSDDDSSLGDLEIVTFVGLHKKEKRFLFGNVEKSGLKGSVDIAKWTSLINHTEFQDN